MNQSSKRSKQDHPTRVAIACQGGGSHAAYVAGALQPLLTQLSDRSAMAGPLQLVGISGTSGGAICALMAWWGLLTGGPKRAIERLEVFWERNSAQRMGEVLWNVASISALEVQPCETQWSPYGPPLRETLSALTKWWPHVAGLMGEWLRPDYFVMSESIGNALIVDPAIDFDETVAAIGKLCSFPADVQDWQAETLDESLRQQDGGLPGTTIGESPAVRFARIRDKVDDAMRVLSKVADELGSEGWLSDAVREFRESCAGPYAKLVADPLPSSYQEGEERMLRIEAVLHPAISRIPRLMLGAVEVDSGRFQAFRSDRLPEHGGITMGAVLASAAIPYIFEAVHVNDEYGNEHPYWDGLFSQNPPIKSFLDPTGRTPLGAESKPDEIWIIQVNPRRCHTKQREAKIPRSLFELAADHYKHTKAAKTQFDIFDRRNELSGNLSLMQEADFIDSVNRLLEDDEDEKHAGRYQRIQVFFIPLDDKAARAKTGRSLGFSSKVCRDKRLKDGLMEHGVGQAEKFLPVREFMIECLNQDDPKVRQAYADLHPELAGLTQEVERLRKAFPRDFQVFIEETAIGEHPACHCRSGRDWDISLHWRAWAARELTEGRRQRAALTGKVHFNLAYGKLRDGLINHVNIDEVRS